MTPILKALVCLVCPQAEMIVDSRRYTKTELEKGPTNASIGEKDRVLMILLTGLIAVAYLTDVFAWLVSGSKTCGSVHQSQLKDCPVTHRSAKATSAHDCCLLSSTDVLIRFKMRAMQVGRANVKKEHLPEEMRIADTACNDASAPPTSPHSKLGPRCLR